MTRARDLANIGPGVPTGFRNKIINGDMRVNQRGNYSTTSNAYQYTTDRWWVFSGVSTVGAPSYVSSTGLTGFPFALRAQRQASNSGTSGIVVGQTIESTNVYALQGQTITVSFWARAGANFSSSANALTAYVASGTGTDQGTLGVINQIWTGISVTGIGTATLTTSWQKFNYNYAVPATATELALEFLYTASGTAGANDYFDITGVQVELGSTATPFEQRPIQTELSLCQRYFQRLVEPPLRGVWNTGNNYGRLSCSLLVQMRIAPLASAGGSLTISGSLPCWDGAATGTITSYSTNYSTNQAIEIDGPAATGTFTALRPALIYKSGSTSNYIDASAEL